MGRCSSVGEKYRYLLDYIGNLLDAFLRFFMPIYHCILKEIKMFCRTMNKNNQITRATLEF